MWARVLICSYALSPDQIHNTTALLNSVANIKTNEYQNAAYLFAINECHAAICVAGRADRFDFMPPKLHHITVDQVLIGLCATIARYYTLYVRQQLLQISGAGDVVSMHMRVHCGMKRVNIKTGYNIIVITIWLWSQCFCLKPTAKIIIAGEIGFLIANERIYLNPIIKALYGGKGLSTAHKLIRSLCRNRCKLLF